MNKKYKVIVWALLLFSAVMLSIPFLVPGCGAFSLLAFVPLLCAERIMSQLNMKCVWLRLYCAFVLWNAFTTFWVCNATVGGGIAAIVLNAAQMTVIFCLFRFVKKRFGGVLPYIFLAVAWIAWERAYFSADISWPWLTLGNSFAGTLPLVQWYRITGTLGGSLWIWACNLSVFGIMTVLSDGRWSNRFNIKAKIASIVCICALFVVPAAYSLAVWYSPMPDPDGEIEVLEIQPNIDPYHKFEAMTQRQQNELLLGMAEKAVVPEDSLRGLLILAPETFTNDITVGYYNQSPTWRTFVSFLSKHPGTEMLFGASSYEYEISKSRPSYTARRVADSLWYESHNSALLVDAAGRTEIYHKSRLVVAVEMMPYPRVFAPIDKALGGVMGHCIGQDSVSLLHFRDSIPIGCAVCYESVYGDFYRDYILKGAKAMTVITNDAWWGDTPGYKQHNSYASLRAIETGRAIARCGNTGLSGFIDIRGRAVQRGPWWQQAVLRGSLPLYSEMTPFVVYGDVVGKLCVWLFWMLLCAAVVKKWK